MQGEEHQREHQHRAARRAHLFTAYWKYSATICAEPCREMVLRWSCCCCCALMGALPGLGALPGSTPGGGGVEASNAMRAPTHSPRGPSLGTHPQSHSTLRSVCVSQTEPDTVVVASTPLHPAPPVVRPPPLLRPPGPNINPASTPRQRA